jgi:hypothetical protein
MQQPEKQMEEKSAIVESDKINSEKYKGNLLQIYLPMSASGGMTEMFMLPTICISRKK